MLSPEQAIAILESVGAIQRNGHYVYVSGQHATDYVNKDAVYADTEKTSLLCDSFAEYFAGAEITAVAAPAVGGAILSTWTANHLTRKTRRKVYATYANKVKGLKREEDFAFLRGYDRFIRGQRVLVVEDNLTTGGTLQKVIGCVRALGGHVVGVGVLCNIGNVSSVTLDVPEILELAPLRFEAIPEEECRRSGPCAKGIPVDTSVGHGREFMARMAATTI